MDEIRIGSHLLQPSRQLLKEGQRVALGPRALSIVSLLAARTNEVVTKDEILEAVWADTIVEENALQVHIAALRKALGEDAGLIETIRGVGYQLHQAEIGEDSEHSADPAPEEPAKAPSEESQPEPSLARKPAPTRFPALGRGWMLGGLAGLATAIALVALFLFLPGTQPEAEPAPPSQSAPLALVVLPFSVTGMEDNDRIGGAIASSLSSELGRLPGLRIIAGTSAKAMAQQSLTANEIGERFDIDLIIEGEIVQTDSALSASVRLVDTATSSQIWTDTVEVRSGEIQRLQGRLLVGTATTLRTRLDTSVPEIELVGEIDPEAYRYYLRGLDGFNYPGYVAERRRDGYRNLTRAIELDPGFAEAWALRARLLQMTYPDDVGLADNKEKADQVRSDIDQALKIDPDNITARAALSGIILLEPDGIERAQALLREVLAEDPSNIAAHLAMANTYFAVSDGEKMIEWVERSFRLDPFTLLERAYAPVGLYRTGDYDRLMLALDGCELCVQRGRFYRDALIGLATPEEIARDLPRVASLIREDAASEKEAKRDLAILRAIETGDRVPQDILDDLLASWLGDIALAGWLGAPEDEVFDAIDMHLEQTKFDARIFSNILVDSRYSLPARMRANPRYREYFNTQMGRNILAYRTKNGLAEGMPLALSEVAQEERRLAPLRGPPPR